MLNTNSLGAFIRILCSAKFRLRYYLDGINIPKRRLTLNTLRIRITRTNLNTLPALPIRTVSWQDNIYLIIQSLDHLESVHDEADEVWEDGEQVHHVQGRRHELQLAGGTEEAHRVLWARVRIYGLDNSNMQDCRRLARMCCVCIFAWLLQHIYLWWKTTLWTRP